MFLYAEKWRGSITVSSIKIFFKLSDLKDYVETLEGKVFYSHAWHISEGSEPVHFSKQELKAVGLRK